MNSHGIELLAPAGDWDAFLAAVENGADAVYLGGKFFSARKSANNFDMEEIKAACNYAHLRGSKVYVTANTLIDNGELADAITFLTKLYNVGVDAVILQDAGLMYLAAKLLPKLPIHASTQMAIINSYGADLLKDLGLERVVLARELSLENIALIHQGVPGMELEVFCHGALCVSYSGQCLMSSLIGGRSGNRGACAQPCRLNYQLVDQGGEQVTVTEVGEHLLSPKDLFTLDLLPELVTAGVKSLKIEGRMKRPEYVAIVAANYAKGLDRIAGGAETEYHIYPEEERELKQVFNRDFTRAFLAGNPGRDYISYKRPNNRGLLLGRVTNFDKNTNQAQVKLELPLMVGDGIEVWISQGGRVATSLGRILVGKQQVTDAQPGQSVLIDLPKRVNPGDRVFKTHDQKLITRAQSSYREGKKKIRITLKAEVALEKPFRLELWDDQGNHAQFESQVVGAKAEKRPVTEENLMEQLNRLGNTPFVIGNAQLSIESGVMLPVSVINQVRREAIDRLETKRTEGFTREKLDVAQVVAGFNGLLKEHMPSNRIKGEHGKREGKRPELMVNVGSLAALKAALGAGVSGIYVGGEQFRSGNNFTPGEMGAGIRLCKKEGVKVILTLPRIIHDNQLPAGLKELVTVVGQVQPDGILIGNLGGIKLAKTFFPGVPAWGDYFLNTFNWASTMFFYNQGLARITLSPELTMQQIRGLVTSNVSLEILIHGTMLMMTTEYCPVGSLVGGRQTGEDCSMPCVNKKYGLKDRMNFVFPVEQDKYCRSYIYNPKKLCMIEHIRELAGLGVDSWRLELSNAGPDEVRNTVEIYRREFELFYCNPRTYDNVGGETGKKELAEYSKAGFTKGHYYRGVLES